MTRGYGRGVARPFVILARLLGVVLVAAVVTAVLAAALTEHTVQFVQANTSESPKIEFNDLAHLPLHEDEERDR